MLLGGETRARYSIESSLLVLQPRQTQETCAALEDILSIQLCQINILDILMQLSHKKKMNVFIHIKAFWKDPFGGK